ncbi:MAG: exosortase C-terminal domain/associated protein EpsI [Pseudomonadota bacterium]
MASGTPKALLASALMLAAAMFGGAVSPAGGTAGVTAPTLERLLPDAFGVWSRVALSDAVLPQETDLGPGEAIAYRSYQDDLGRKVTLVAAYGPPLGDSVRLHRPETCYVAQGFTIEDRKVETMSLSGAGGWRRAVDIVHLATKSPARREAVTYWLRSGDTFTTDARATQFLSFQRGAAQLDGAMIRVSSQGDDDILFGLHQRFLNAFAAALDEEGAALLIGIEPADDEDILS